MFVFFGMLNFCFKKLGCDRETRDNRLVAGRGHRVQGELCVGGFVCCKWRYLKMLIRETEGELKNTDDRISDIESKRVIIKYK